MARWVRWVVATAVVLTVAVSAGAAYVVLRDRSTPVDIDETVERYREDHDDDAPERTPDTASLPPEGVFVYATEGDESIDVLGGSTHGYPDRTTVTVTHTGCGVRQRWDALVERWDDELLCPGRDGRERRTLRTHHEFFGMSDDAEFRCDAGYVVLPAAPEPGDTWSTSCEADGTALSGTGEVVGTERQRVGSELVDTVHVRITEEPSGTNTGTSSDDYWLRIDDGLLIARRSTVETRSDSPVGTATYTEAFTLRLTSLRPRT